MTRGNLNELISEGLCPIFGGARLRFYVGLYAVQLGHPGRYLQVRLKFVFLRIVEIVTCDIDSIYPSSTVLFASSRSVHLESPSGGCPHASAMTCASTSPVTFAGIGGVSRFFLVIVASSLFLQ